MVANSLSLNNLSLNILSLNSLSLNNISLNSLSLNSLSLTFSVMVAKSLSEQLMGRRPRLRNREDAELHVGVLFWVFSFFVPLRLLFFWAFSCVLSYLRIWEDGELDVGSQRVVQHRGDHAGQVGQQLALGALQDCRHFDYFLGLLWPDMAHFLLKCVFWFSWLINLEWNLHIWAEENHNHSKTHHFNDICLLIIDIQIPQPYHLWPVHQPTVSC